MKIVLFLMAMAIALVPAAVQAAVVSVTLDEKGVVAFDNYSERAISESMGAFTYVYADEGWGEAYAGPTWQKGAFKVGLGAGVEAGQSEARLGGFVCYIKDRLALEYNVEDGGSGFWHRPTVTVALDERHCGGALFQTGKGAGIFLQRNLGNGVALKVRAFEGGKSDVAILVGM